MPLTPLRRPGLPRPKVSVVVQAIGGLAIFVSLARLFTQRRRFNEQRTTNAAGQMNQRSQGALDHADRPKEKSGWNKASVIVQAIGGLAIFVSVAGLFVSIRQFNDQQATNATDLVNQRHQTTLDTY